MELINKYAFLTSRIDVLKERIKSKNELIVLDEKLIIEKYENKLNEFIEKEKQKLYLFEFALKDLNKEINLRLPEKMRRYNIKDYWHRREAIQKWRVANYSEEATKALNDRIIELNELKAKEEEKVRKNLIKEYSPYIASTDEERKVKLDVLNKEKELSNERIEKIKVQLKEKEDKEIKSLKERFSKEVKDLNNRISNFEKQLKELKKNTYTLEKDVVLKVEELTMQFGGLKAVDNLSFEVKKGEIFGLIGPNGAGKTTVFNCITQFYKPTKGNLYFLEKSGNTISLNDYVVHDVIKKGIVRTFQNVEVVKEVSVLENLLISAHTQYKSNFVEQLLHLPILKKEEISIRKKAEEVLEFMGLSMYKDWLAWGLPYGILKKVEIARTLMNNPQLIILDEPAAGLNDSETAELTQLIKKIQEKYECTILLIEHDMGLVMDLCDRICAISFGKLLAIGTPEEIQANKDVQSAYLGVSEEE